MYNIFLTSPINIFDNYIKEINSVFTKRFIKRHFNTKIVEYFVISRVEPTSTDYINIRQKFIKFFFENNYYSLNDKLLNDNLFGMFNFNWIPKSLKNSNIEKFFWKFVKISTIPYRNRPGYHTYRCRLCQSSAKKYAHPDF